MGLGILRLKLISLFLRFGPVHLISNATESENSEGQDLAFPKIAIRGLLHLMNESQISCSTVDRKREGLNDVTYCVSHFTGISATNIIAAVGISSNMKGL